MMNLICIVVVVAISSRAQAGAIRYVDDDAPGAGDGLSWNTAYLDLTAALNEAQGGEVALVRIAQGNYAEGGGFTLVGGVAYLGGYAGVGAPDPDARDPSVFVTVLNGNNNHRVLFLVDDSTVVLDGLEIRNGMVDVAGGDGAGFRATGNGTIVFINNCRFVNNHSLNNAGGIDVVNLAMATIQSCTFTNNSAVGDGGAIRASGGVVDVFASTFLNNTAGRGGAGFSLNMVVACNFVGNMAASE